MRSQSQLHLARYYEAHDGYASATICKLPVAATGGLIVTIAPHDDTCDDCVRTRASFPHTGPFVGVMERA